MPTFRTGDIVSAPYILLNNVAIDEQMKPKRKEKKPMYYVARIKEYIPGATECNLCYLDPEPIPDDEEPPLLNGFPMRHLREVNSSTYYTHTKKWNQLTINEQVVAMDVARATNDVRGHDKRATPTQRRARDESEPASMDIDEPDEPDSNPRPLRRQRCLQAIDACTQGAGALCTIVANAGRSIWQRSASSNAANVQSADQIPVVPVRTMNNMRTGPSRLSALSPSRNDAQRSPVAQQQLAVAQQQLAVAPQQLAVAQQQLAVAQQQSPVAQQQSPVAPAPQQTGWDIFKIPLIVVAYLVSTPVGLWLALVSFETAVTQYGWCTLQGFILLVLATILFLIVLWQTDWWGGFKTWPGRMLSWYVVISCGVLALLYLDY